MQKNDDDLWCLQYDLEAVEVAFFGLLLGGAMIVTAMIVYLIAEAAGAFSL